MIDIASENLLDAHTSDLEYLFIIRCATMALKYESCGLIERPHEQITELKHYLKL